MKKFLIYVGAFVIGVVVILSLVAFALGSHWFWNEVDYIDQKIDDATSYDTRKSVEDTCRAMIASYKSDRLTWEQYKDSDGEKLSWAEQARMRANRTAMTYNEYILKNSFVWNGNVPDDILGELETI